MLWCVVRRKLKSSPVTVSKCKKCWRTVQLFRRCSMDHLSDRDRRSVSYKGSPTISRGFKSSWPVPPPPFLFLWPAQRLQSNLEFLCLNRAPVHRDSRSTSGSSNELRVQLRCSCLLCCERRPVIDVIPWSSFTAASNILLFMSVCFHPLCARICVRLCVCKYRLCKYICTLMLVCMFVCVRVCVCASFFYKWVCSCLCKYLSWLPVFWCLPVWPLGLSPLIALIQRLCMQH